jgi:CBS domain-containing protein
MKEIKVSEVMSRQVVTVGPGDRLADAAARLANAKVSAAPVVDGGVVVGILSESDLLHAVYRSPTHGSLSVLDHLMVRSSRRRRRHEQEPTVVGDAMSPIVFTASPEDTLAAAAGTMERHGVKRLPVLDDGGALVGIVSRADLVRALAETESTAAPVVVEGVGEVVLEIGTADPNSSAVQRLTHRAASRALASNPDVRAVKVVTPDGRMLAMISRAAPVPADESIVLEPRHRSHGHAPSVPPTTEEPVQEGPVAGGGRWMRAAVAGLRPHDQAPKRSVADQFDVPPAVQQLLRDPDDLVDLVRATFEAAGLEVQVDDDTLVVEGVALIVVPVGMGSPLGRDSLDRAFRRFLESGADVGSVITLGLMDHSDVVHRELFVPQLGHAGFETVQGMLDAVAVGGDPLEFVRTAPSRRR